MENKPLLIKKATRISPELQAGAVIAWVAELLFALNELEPI